MVPSLRLRIRSVLAVLALALALPALSGCTPSFLQILIPDFESAAVDGVQLWRLDDATGAPIPSGQIVFEALESTPEEELLRYRLQQPDGTTLDGLYAQVERDATDPDAVRVNFTYLRPEGSGSGWFKISTFNDFGSSPLSSQQTFL